MNKKHAQLYTHVGGLRYLCRGSDNNLSLKLPILMVQLLPVCAQVFRTEIISRRLNKTATWPLMASALATVAAISIGAAAITHPAVSLRACSG